MKRIFLFLCLCVLMLSACIVDKIKYYPVAEAVILQITAINKMDLPVELKIRHYYDFDFNGKGGHTIVYSNDSKGLIIAPGEESAVGTETVTVSNKTATWEETGFALVDSRFIIWESFLTISSFEVEITAGDITTILAGYPTADSHFAENGLVYTKTKMGWSADGAELNTKTQSVHVKYQAVYVLPATLTINNDGTYLFETAVMQEDDSIDHVFTQG